ncbi:MAG: sulfotransferase [Pseudomonadales bacterium]
MTYSKEQLYRMARQALSTGDMRAAVFACREVNASYPDYFEGWGVASELHLKLKRPEAALMAAEKALDIRPSSTKALLQKVECWLSTDNKKDAATLLLELADKEYREVQIYDRLGMLFTQLDMHEQSLPQFQKASNLEPDNPAALYNLAACQRFNGDLVDAENTLDRMLIIKPSDHEGQAMRSSLRKQTVEHNHVEELQGILASSDMTDQGQVQVCYAMAKEFDDIDDVQNAYRYLAQGADIKRSRMRYDVQTDLDIIASIRDAYNHQIFQSGINGHSSKEPIFIIGLPRTGTTLVERVLGSHSDVYAAGELSNFSRELMRQVQVNYGEEKIPREELASCTTKMDFSRLGADYINSTRPLTGELPRFIDKLPFNFLYAGLIHLALPDAKIIHVTRHPMAACYAIYKQLFKDAYPYSYNQEDLGRYYIAYHQLMSHWNTVMPGVIYSLSYESVVADLESESRKLLNFCELPWEDQCLKFYESKQASTTASASQVRKPVYSSSVNRWRAYEDELQPLRAILEGAGIDVS